MDIIKLASEAASGMLSYDAEGNWRLGEKEVERFATLVRAAALGEAAGVCIETGSTKGSCDAAFDIADACADAIRAMKEQV